VTLGDDPEEHPPPPNMSNARPTEVFEQRNREAVVIGLLLACRCIGANALRLQSTYLNSFGANSIR
jgi:hypothetical protein